MRVERPNVERAGQIDLITRCDNMACERERHDGYTAPWMGFAGSVRLTPDGWLHVGNADACSWACLSVVAADRAKMTVS
mgnify:CR=1 FL=1